MATVLITGGSGLVGEALTKSLQERGFEVATLSRARNAKQQLATYSWDIRKSEIDKEAIAVADYIVHLSGANIGAKRWTKKRKQQIIESRTKSGELIFNEVRRQNKNLMAFISASAVGYYGAITSGKLFCETDPSGGDFLGETCEEWERTADRFNESGIRTVKIRTGVVLTKQGGALSKMLAPIKAGFGSAIGSGKQYMPWIHMEDLCGIYIKAIEETEMVGAYNAVAPEHITNREFTQKAAEILKRPLWMPNVPAFVLKLMFGKMSEILLKGSRVSSQKIQTAGYRFLFPGIDSALKQLLQ